MPLSPGMTTSRTVTPRDIYNKHAHWPPAIVGVTLDGALGYDGGNTSYEEYIRGGWWLAKLANGQYVPCKRTRANGAGAAATALIVDNAAAFKVGDDVVIGPNAAVNADAINYSTNTITIASAKTWNDEAPVYVVGAETAIGILEDDEAVLLTRDKTAAADVSAQMCIAGYIDVSQLLGDTAAILSDSESRKAIRMLFLDDYHDGTTQENAPMHSIVFDYTVATLAAGVDLAETIIFQAAYDLTVTDVVIMPTAAWADVDDSNTSVWLVQRNSADTIVTETFDSTTTAPAAGAQVSLGAMTNAQLSQGDRIDLTITNGTTAAVGATLLGIKYRYGIEG